MQAHVWVGTLLTSAEQDGQCNLVRNKTAKLLQPMLSELSLSVHLQLLKSVQHHPAFSSAAMNGI
jgi:hypothetical protein